MAKNTFVRATPLHNVKGRISYISDPKRQERLLAFYDAMPDGGWEVLSQESQQSAKYNPGKKVCEARELIYMLPAEFEKRFNPQSVAKKIADDLYAAYGVKCAVAIHQNKKDNNYHAHAILPEREIAKVDRISFAKRNTYFDQNGKRSTKSKCTDAEGKLLPGCGMVAKGEILSQTGCFGPKKDFASREWLKNEKKRYVDFINSYAREEKWQVYNGKNDYHLTQLHVGKKDSEGLREWKEYQNELTRMYNESLDRLLAAGEINVHQAFELKYQVLRQKKEMAAERRAERERRKLIREEERREWSKRQIAERRYLSELRRMNSFELTVLLILILAGHDPLQKQIDAELNIDRQNSSYEPVGLVVHHDEKIQKMIDDIHRSAGKEPPRIGVKKKDTQADVIERAQAIHQEAAERPNKLDERIAEANTRVGVQNAQNGPQKAVIEQGHSKEEVFQICDKILCDIDCGVDYDQYHRPCANVYLKNGRYIRVALDWEGDEPVYDVALCGNKEEEVAGAWENNVIIHGQIYDEDLENVIETTLNKNDSTPIKDQKIQIEQSEPTRKRGLNEQIAGARSRADSRGEGDRGGQGR